MDSSPTKKSPSTPSRNPTENATSTSQSTTPTAGLGFPPYNINTTTQPPPPPIQDSNARAAQAFLTTTSRRKLDSMFGGDRTGGKRSSVAERHQSIPVSQINAQQIMKNSIGGLDYSPFSPSSADHQQQHQLNHMDRTVSRSLNDINRSSVVNASYLHSQMQPSPDRPSLSSPDIPYNIPPSFTAGTGELAVQTRILGESGILTSDPQFEDDYITQTGLDLEAVISHFESVHMQNRSTSPLKSHARPFGSSSTAYPRFTFYSEKTGVIRSNSWDAFDISTFDDDMNMPTAPSLASTMGREGSVRDTLTTSPFWIDIASPSHHEMAAIAKVFNLHPLTSEDIQTHDTREKCEVFQRYYFVVIRSFEQDQFKPNFLQPITVYIVIFDECILSFQSNANPHSRNVRSRIDQLSSYGDVSITTEWINYALIDDITDSFIPLLKIVELEVDSIEELVLIPVMKNDYQDMDMLRRIGMVRKRVMQLLRLISTKADVVKTIITRYMNQQEPSPQTGSVFLETKYYLEDIHDHVLTMMQNLNHYEKSLARSHSNYLAQISIDITQASNRTSDTVMRMTLLASILVPLNVITGLFGMNVRVPGEDGADLGWFFGIIAFMFVLTTSTYYLAKRYKLI